MRWVGGVLAVLSLSACFEPPPTPATPKPTVPQRMLQDGSYINLDEDHTRCPCPATPLYPWGHGQ